MKKNNKKGFTLVELVIVVAVMAILVAVAIPTIGSISATAKKSVYLTNCRTIESIVKLAEAEKVKDTGTSTTSTGITLGAEAAAKACNDAKLGIVSDTFYLHTKTGVVNNSATSLGEGDTVYTLTFDANGSCSNATGTPTYSATT